jgi:hypothetical protein
MNSRLTMRRMVSLTLVSVIALWAQSGLAVPPADSHGMQCHGHAEITHQPTSVANGQTFTSPPAYAQEHANSVPCCPLQPESLPPECGDRPCCLDSGEPVRPLAFLVSGTPLERQLRADGPSTGFFPLPQTHQHISGRVGGVPQYAQPVTEKKTDLRI